MAIADVNRAYHNMGELHLERPGRGIVRRDIVTHESLLKAANYVQVFEEGQGLVVARLEEIAFGMGYIDRE